MKKLNIFLNSLTLEKQLAFARQCGTTRGYLRKAISIKQRLGESLCINIERESGGVIRCEYLRPDVDWEFIRSSRLDDFQVIDGGCE
jgi:DNA-binding transcriptional regulator YdaS (Cro superfamily)